MRARWKDRRVAGGRAVQRLLRCAADKDADEFRVTDTRPKVNVMAAAIEKVLDGTTDARSRIVTRQWQLGSFRTHSTVGR